MKTLLKKIAVQGFESRSYRQEGIVGYFEKRCEARIAYKSRIKIKELKSGVFINARMLHYSENGVYVEANRLLLPGTVIYLGIEDSPFIPFANVYDVYRAEIVWLRLLNSMSYKYGYGIKFILTPPKLK
jgi:hypothetical protein